MKKLFALLLFVSTVAFGQSYPSPTYNNVTVLGVATAPTPAIGANTTQLATTAFDVSGKFCPSLLDHGGGTGLSDNSAALTATIAASAAINANDICVYVPPGNFNFTSQYVYTLPSTSAAITLKGAGADVTSLTWAAGGGLKINYLGPYNSAHIQNLSVLTGTTNTGSGILLNQTAGSISNPAVTSPSDITNVTFRGSDGYVLTDYWAAGVTVASVSNVTFFGVNMEGPAAVAGTGISVSGTAAVIPVVFPVINSNFNNLAVGFNYGTYTQGVSVISSNFTGDNDGILVPSGAVGLDQLIVEGSQFNCQNFGIYDQVGVGATLIHDNLFIVIAATNGVGIQITNAVVYTISGNEFNIQGTIGATYPVGVVIASSLATYSGVISGNQFDHMKTAILLQASSANVNVQANAYSNNTTNVTNSGTNNNIGGVVGTTLADNAIAGNVGEYITATGTAVPMSTGANTNITSISLSAGDWDVWGNMVFIPSGTTQVGPAGLYAGASLTSGNVDAAPSYSSITGVTYAAGNAPSLIAPTRRINVATTTTVYLVAQANFTVSTLTGTGILQARRMR